MTRHHDEQMGPAGIKMNAQEKKDLCDRILLSTEVHTKADKARIVISHLFDSSINGHKPKAGEILQVMTGDDRPPDDPNAAIKLMKRVRLYLHRYFAARGPIEEPVRVEVDSTRSGYELRFVSNSVSPEARFFAQEFWKPHLSAGQAVSIIYTEPLFTRDEAFTEFVRRVQINSRADLNAAQEFCYSHVPLGEVVATLKLMKKLWNWGQETVEEGCRKEIGYDEVMKSSKSNSFIVLGAARANGFIDSLQRDTKLDILATEDSINIKNLRPHEKTPYRESQTNENVIGYVVVTRLRRMGRWITMFHGNHGQAISRLVQLFLDDHLLRELYQN